MCMATSLYGFQPRCVLVLSTGGGGDVATAAMLAEALRRERVGTVIAASLWERFVRDPAPGPIPLEALSGAEPIASGDAARLSPGCSALREGRLLEPAACKVASLLPIPVYAVNTWGGELSIRRAVEEIAGIHGCDALLDVDVGGDVLAEGHEEELWSPLGDSLGLAAAANSGLPAVLAVHSLGADGELPEERLLERIAQIARSGGYRWIRGLDAIDLGLLEELFQHVETEAGKIALLAARGQYGSTAIRGGTRVVRITVYQAATVFLNARETYEHTPPAKAVAGSSSLEEARRRLNSIGVYTELDLEEDIHPYIVLGRLTPKKLLELRNVGRRRIQGASD
ncbi:DUF1152 domain-containing protein [Pyrodictium delaneyi]|uniref:DUF1152 domain-containing protein n=2 Tax=Pyrodictium delaneyi TaxID=1273541 RepID=A0A211YQZ8_9CREN|nr:DUF1152 domain-containing protein [Pyrodictium delaneyi]OWJ55381.1 hypothetical protein Pdsh_00780 [Pyrodictium delaneyi]